MKYTTAQFWAETITSLMAGHRVVVIDAREWLGWEPEIDVVTLEGAKAFPYDHAPGDGHFHITSSYGVHDGLDTAEIHPDNREIVMYSATAAGGKACWRVLRDLDASDNWPEWNDAMRASWRLQ
jgi:hypothetical protein